MVDVAWAPSMAFVGAFLLVIGTIVPYGASGEADLRLVDFEWPTGALFGGVLAWWAPAVVIVGVSVLLVVAPRRFAIGLLLGLAAAMLVSHLGLLFLLSGFSERVLLGTWLGIGGGILAVVAACGAAGWLEFS